MHIFELLQMETMQTFLVTVEALKKQFRLAIISVSKVSHFSQHSCVHCYCTLQLVIQNCTSAALANVATSIHEDVCRL